MITADSLYFSDLLKIIDTVLDFDTSSYSNNFLARRIDVRRRALGINSYKKYMHHLIAHKAEQEKLNKVLTIHVTEFFRDKPMWEVLKEKVLPVLAKRSHVTVWSAGCSTGEEAISLAISFFEHIGIDGGTRLEIIGTDIEEDVIEKAKLCLYDISRFEKMDPMLVDKYFLRMGHVTYRAKDIIRDVLTYEKGDIITIDMEKHIDLLLCRNTMIYMNMAGKRKIYRKFADVLDKNGLLILGKTEMLMGSIKNKFSIVDARERIYRRINTKK